MTRILTPETDDNRARCGEKNRQSKLTEEEVRLIKELLKIKYLQVSIAEMFKVSRSTIGAIARGETWRWLK